MFKRSIITLFFILTLNSQFTQAQNNAGIAVAAAGALVGAAAALATIENYKEQMELHASEYIIHNETNIKKFELKIIDFDGIKPSDLSNVSCFSFGVRIANEANLEENKVLMMFLSHGWSNEFGIDISRVKWKLLSVEEWDNMFFTYISIASPVKIIDKNNIPIFTKTAKSNYQDNENYFVQKNAVEGSEIFQRSPEITKIGSIKLENSEIKYLTTDVSGKSKIDLAFPIAKYNNDTYLMKDFSSEFKLIYNEKTMGLYIKSLGKLVQLKRSTINLIHSYLHYL